MRLLAQADNQLQQVFGSISPPEQIKTLTDKGGAGGISYFVTTLISLLFTVAGIVFVFMILFGAFQWIMSGGEKEGISKARGRIINAIIGIALLATSFLILKVLGVVLGFQFFDSSAAPCNVPRVIGQPPPC